MKPIQIFLGVLIVIGLGLLITQKLWVPKPAAPVSLDGSPCHETDKYFVIGKSVEGSVGSTILVKYKKTPDEHFACSYTVEKGDFEINNEDADYFLALTDNFLVVDRGTAPDPRTLLIYDLRSHAQVYTGRYSSPWSVAGDTITFWNPVGVEVTAANCPKLAEYTSQGLSSVIESNVTLNLSTLTRKESGEYRCVATQ